MLNHHIEFEGAISDLQIKSDFYVAGLWPHTQNTIRWNNNVGQDGNLHGR